VNSDGIAREREWLASQPPVRETWKEDEERIAAAADPATVHKYTELTATATVQPRAVSPVPDIAGDHLNASRFLAKYGRDVRRSPQLDRWFIWNGQWWVEDRLDVVLEMATEVIDELRMWVAEAEGPDDFKRRSAHYTASTKAGRREGLLAIAGTEANIRVAVDDLDSHPMLLACRNGTVDLETGELRSANRADLITHGIGVDYVPEAQSDLWDDFVATIFGEDAELVGYVQRLLGYCVTGSVVDHVLPVCHGQGGNGKSTLVGIVQDLLGDHAIAAPEGLVIQHKHDVHPERIATLRGKRLVVSNELEDQARLAEQTVKMLTGGDTLSARELYGQRFNFKPSHKILIFSNHRPAIVGRDHAIWRRVKLVPFNYTVPDDKRVDDLREQLVAEHAPAILSWLVRGAVEWNQTGLGTCTAVDAATAAYRESQDVLARFLDENATATPDEWCQLGHLWDRWRVWCERSGERPGRRQDFADMVGEQHRVSRGRPIKVHGISLVENPGNAA
jgi:putative DNA primase/helicase